MTMFRNGIFTLLILFTTLVTYSQPTTWEWAMSTGGISYSEGYDVAADAAGNVYATGYYINDTIQFGNFQLLNSGTADMYFVKFGPTGNVLFAFKIGQPGYEVGHGISLDGNGHVYITGSFTDSLLSIGTATLTNYGKQDGFIAKYDTAGNFIWARNFGGVDDEEARAIDVDINGNSVVVGVFKSPMLNFGSLQVANPAPSTLNQYFIVRYDPSGNAIWGAADGAAMGDFGNAAAIDNSGNSYIAGAIVPNSDLQLFVSKYSNTGTLLWTQVATGTGSNRAYGMDIDHLGNVIVTGEFRGTTCTIGGQTLTNSGPSGLNQDLLLVKFDASGNVVWAKSEGENLSGDIGKAVEVDQFGNIYLSGDFSTSTFNFGTSVLLNNGVSDVFIACYSSAGNVLWANSGGGPSQEIAHGIAIDGMGGVTSTGSNKLGTLHFGNIVINVPTGNSNVYVAQLNYLTGLHDVSSSDKLWSLFPNPTYGTVSLTGSNVISKIEVYDVTGKQISSHYPNTLNFTFDIKEKGLLFLKVYDRENVSHFKVISN
ncbi:MAG: T9SS type A sorting domain-containing protein [Bacteroidia bacterium]|nr:T9SS type A sorting domain-containing protein [Bacteroidia bacterium]